jgi:hypothetical protein
VVLAAVGFVGKNFDVVADHGGHNATDRRDHQYDGQPKEPRLRESKEHGKDRSAPVTRREIWVRELGPTRTGRPERAASGSGGLSGEGRRPGCGPSEFSVEGQNRGTLFCRLSDFLSTSSWNDHRLVHRAILSVVVDRQAGVAPLFTAGSPACELT